MKPLKPTEAPLIHLLDPEDYLLDPSEVAQILQEYQPKDSLEAI